MNKKEIIIERPRKLKTDIIIRREYIEEEEGFWIQTEWIDGSYRQEFVKYNLKPRSIWSWCKLPIKIVFGVPLILFWAIIFLLFMWDRKGFKMLIGMMKYSWKNKPELVEARMKEFKRYLRNGRRVNRG